MPRQYKRRSTNERVADIEKKIADLKAKQAARHKKDDPVLREMQQLQKRLKRFVQLAHDNHRPDVANSAMGFASMLDRLVTQELKPAHASGPADDGGDE